MKGALLTCEECVRLYLQCQYALCRSDHLIEDAMIAATAESPREISTGLMDRGIFRAF
jgi:hypothetical protein